MPAVSFTNLLIICVVAVVAPLLLGLLPGLRVPAVVLEIVAGIMLGPSAFGWVQVDLPVQILALFGLAFLLFLAGLEIDLSRLRGPVLRLAVLGYGATLVLRSGRRPRSDRDRRAGNLTAVHRHRRPDRNRARADQPGHG